VPEQPVDAVVDPRLVADRGLAGELLVAPQRPLGEPRQHLRPLLRAGEEVTVEDREARPVEHSPADRAPACDRLGAAGQHEVAVAQQLGMRRARHLDLAQQ
jgi:hypothetical protein